MALVLRGKTYKGSITSRQLLRNVEDPRPRFEMNRDGILSIMYKAPTFLRQKVGVPTHL